MKRIVVILAIILSFSIFCISASADSIVTDATVNEASVNAENLPAEEEKANENTSVPHPIVGEKEDAPLSNVQGSENEAAPDTPQDEHASDERNVFSMLYELVLTYATEILSALAAVVSCFLAFGYKKGLLPLLQQGLGVISGTVSRLGEKAELANQTVCEQSEATRLISEKIEEAVREMSQGILEVSERLNQLEQARDERIGIREALIGEIDMLSEIFLASSLPEYRKEKIGITVAKLKEQLADTKGA